MKKIILFLFLISSPPFLFSQPTQSWVARYDSPTHFQDNPIAMTIDGAGNTYIVGTSELAITSPPYLYPIDAVIIKYNSSGAQQWAAVYSNIPGSYKNYAKSVGIDNSGNVYVGGSSTRLDGTHGEMFILKYNSNGDQQWIIKKSGGDTAIYGGTGIFVDNSGFFAVGGSYINSVSNTIIFRYNLNGVLQWYHQTDSVAFTKVIKGPDGSFNMIYDNFPAFVTLKFNSAGVFQWIRVDSSSDAHALAVDMSGNVYVTGESYGATSNRDYITKKYNSSGELQWVAIYNGPLNQKDRAYAITVDNEGNSYVTGESAGLDNSYDCTTIKYNTNGDVVWIRRYSYASGSLYDETGRDISLDSKGNVYVTGYGVGDNTSNDYLTLVYTTNGDQIGVVRYNSGGSGSDYANKVLADSHGNFYVTGSISSNYSDIATIKYSLPVNINPVGSAIPKNFNLEQNYPNPFNPTTNINYDVPVSNFVSLKVYNSIGKEVETFVNEIQTAGSYKVDFNASNLSSGIYFYTLSAGEFKETKKMLLVK